MKVGELETLMRLCKLIGGYKAPFRVTHSPVKTVVSFGEYSIDVSTYTLPEALENAITGYVRHLKGGEKE